MQHLDPEQLAAMSPQEQYLYFVHTVAETGEIWGLYDEDLIGWFLTRDADDRELLPVWPTVQYAEACRKGAWLNGSPLPMSVATFVRETLDELIDMTRGLSVFYLEEEGGLDIAPQQLRKDLLTLTEG